MYKDTSTTTSEACMSQVVQCSMYISYTSDMLIQWMYFLDIHSISEFLVTTYRLNYSEKNSSKKRFVYCSLSHMNVRTRTGMFVIIV